MWQLEAPSKCCVENVTAKEAIELKLKLQKKVFLLALSVYYCTVTFSFLFGIHLRYFPLHWHYYCSVCFKRNECAFTQEKAIC